MSEKAPLPRALILLPVLVFGIALLKTAWITDDAMITLRTVQNFGDGHGLTWNIDERVQVFTHPLWALLLSAAHVPSGEIYYTAVTLSVLVSLAAFVLLGWRIAATPTSGILAMTLLVFSEAFVDYSTSGLENGLTHLLIGLFVLAWAAPAPDPGAGPRRLLRMTLVASLGMTNRLDLVLLFAPALLSALWPLVSDRASLRKMLRPVLRAVALGSLPFVLWETFSVIYYGTPFPNTYYAKMNVGLPYGEVVSQGLVYTLTTFTTDPTTFLGIALGVSVPFVVGASLDRRWQDLPLVLGMLLYMAYIVHVGGDFMVGRFFTPVLFTGAALLARHRLPDGVPKGATGLLALLLVLAVARPEKTESFDPPGESRYITGTNGITDERPFHQGLTGLPQSTRHNRSAASMRNSLPPFLHFGQPHLTTVCGGLGHLGLLEAPTRHIVDTCGLSDPFLARLPALHNVHWRIGHHERAIPAGYLESLLAGENLIEDEDLAVYYEQVRLLTRGRLFDPARWRAIVLMGLGTQEGLVDAEALQFAEVRKVPLTEAADTVFDRHGLEVDLGKARQETWIDIGWGEDEFRLSLLLEDGETWTEHVDRLAVRLGGERFHRIGLPRAVAERGYRTLRLFPVSWKPVYTLDQPADPGYRLSHLRLDDGETPDDAPGLLRRYFFELQRGREGYAGRLAELRQALSTVEDGWQDVTLPALVDLQLLPDPDLVALLRPHLEARLPEGRATLRNASGSVRLRVLGCEASEPATVHCYFESLGGPSRANYVAELEVEGAVTQQRLTQPMQTWSRGRIYRHSFQRPQPPAPYTLALSCQGMLFPCAPGDELVYEEGTLPEADAERVGNYFFSEDQW